MAVAECRQPARYLAVADKAVAATGCADGSVRVWDAATAKPITELRGNVAAAKLMGKQIAEKALTKGIKKVVFDRAKSLYHGRVKAFADAAREGGLEF